MLHFVSLGPGLQSKPTAITRSEDLVAREGSFLGLHWLADCDTLLVGWYIFSATEKGGGVVFEAYSFRQLQLLYTHVVPCADLQFEEVH